MKRIIFMLAVIACVPALVQAYTLEAPVFSGGWTTLWNMRMSEPMNMNGSAIQLWGDTNFLSGPGAQKSIQTPSYFVRQQGNYAAGQPAANVAKYGVEWIDPSWSGKSADTAVVASYITPGMVMGQESKGYQIAHPKWPWEKQIFKADARISVVGGAGAKLFVQAYGYTNTGSTQPWNDSSVLNATGYALIDLANFTAGTWQNIQMTLPKSTYSDAIEPWEDNTYKSWFEIGIIGGNANTKVYIDEFYMVSDQDAGAGAYLFTPGMVPEPATMSLLALGALGLIKRRK